MTVVSTTEVDVGMALDEDMSYAFGLAAAVGGLYFGLVLTLWMSSGDYSNRQDFWFVALAFTLEVGVYSARC